MKDTPLQQACLKAGGQSKLADLLGTTQSKVWYWLKRAKKGVAGEYVLQIERHTGVSRHMLRPDLYPVSAPSIPSSDDTGDRDVASSRGPTSRTPKSQSVVGVRAASARRRRQAAVRPA